MTNLQPIKAHEYCEETIALKDKLENSFLELGERLTKIRNEQVYIKAGYESFALFLWEIKMTESVASKIITVYENLVLRFGVDKEKIIAVGGYSIAYPIAQMVKSKEEAEHWLEKGSLLNKKDLEDEIRELKKGTHLCDFKDLHIRQCLICGKKEKIYENVD